MKKIIITIDGWSSCGKSTLAKQLAKRFAQGDHVKVINGIHQDETGMVLNVDNNVGSTSTPVISKKFF